MLAAIAFSVVSFFTHAVYVSVTEITYAGNGQWEVSCRLFYNDLEDAIRNQTGQSVSLANDEQVARAASLVAGYINTKMKLQGVDGQPLALKWEDGHLENDSVWCRFTVTAAQISAIENRLLTELFATQQNVVTLINNGERRYFRFNREVERLPVKP